MRIVILALLFALLAPSLWGRAGGFEKSDFSTCIQRAVAECQAARCAALGEDACGFAGTTGQGCWDKCCLVDPCQEAAANACTALAVKKLKLWKPSR